MPRLSSAVGAGFGVWGLAVGLIRLHDNSFMTHVATGRIILAHGIPHADPYSFTAHGHSWVVESWLASALYGVVDQTWSGHGLQLLHAALATVLALITWMLTKPARTLAGRIAVSCAVLAVGTGYWSPRPLLIALVLLGVLILITETGRGSVWVVAPVMWLWLNVHGSWPLGVAYLVARIAGRALDKRPLERLPRLFGAAVVGCVAGIANPFGWRLVLYPSIVVTRHAAFAHIAEWQSPSFSNAVNLVFLAEALLAVVLLVARRGTIEDVLVTVLFVGAALTASRNVPVAALVVAPVLARGLADLGTIKGDRAGVMPAAVLAGLVVVGALLVSGALRNPEWNLAAYPVSEVSWMAEHHLVPAKVATPDFVGNYLELRFGARASVFIDDRVDMYPTPVENAYGVLLSGGQGWQGVLDRYGVRTVLWPRDEPLASLVSESPRWTVVKRAPGWVVAIEGTVPTAR